MYVCRTCKANWSAGEWTKGCPECGGGALKIECPMCNGKCGAKWKRAPMDSHDYGVACWWGDCLNPVETKEVPIKSKKRIVETIFVVSDDGHAPIAIEHWEKAENCYIVMVTHNENETVTKSMVKDAMDSGTYRKISRFF